MFGVTKVSSRTSVGFLEAGLEVAVRPARIGVLAHRQTAGVVLLDFRLGPFQIDHFGKRRRLPRRGRRTNPDVPLDTGIRRTRQQRRDRIHAERQPLPPDLDLFDRFSRRQLVDGRHGKHGLALIERLVGQRLLALGVGSNDLAGVVDLILRSRHFVGRQDRSHARHGERRARVDALDARVRIRAEEQPREQHPLGAEVLRVLRAASHFRPEVGGRVVLSDEFLVSHAHTSNRNSQGTVVCRRFRAGRSRR